MASAGGLCVLGGRGGGGVGGGGCKREMRAIERYLHKRRERVGGKKRTKTFVIFQVWTRP